MGGRTVYRLRDIVDVIDQINLLLEGKVFKDVQADRVLERRSSAFLKS